LFNIHEFFSLLKQVKKLKLMLYSILNIWIFSDDSATKLHSGWKVELTYPVSTYKYDLHGKPSQILADFSLSLFQWDHIFIPADIPF
jgi:hypothetical protein